MHKRRVYKACGSFESAHDWLQPLRVLREEKVSNKYKYQDEDRKF